GDPFRHWDEDTIVSSRCTRCHNTNGFSEYAMGDATTDQLPLSTVGCTTCHNQFNLYSNPETRYDAAGENPAIQDVEFPSGATATLGNASNICMGCHQGRSSGVQVANATPNDTIQNPDYPSFNFINIHYYAAAATFFGSDVNGGYEYEGQQYRGRNGFGVHSQLGAAQVLVDCVGCHLNADPAEPEKHTFLPKVADCNACHAGGAFETLRGSPSDNFEDIETLKDELLAAIQAYAISGNPVNSPIVYSSNYPYWVTPSGAPYRDADFTMLTAMYNYHLAQEDPAGYIHNGAYIIELLYDSIVAVGGTPSVPRL
ncbi:MAG TPA: multiheme c-type cytochrome, partial [Polyangiales bacterium]|nr:multiheme c-type cytochrome [Polyangiales bacterium]